MDHVVAVLFGLKLHCPFSESSGSVAPATLVGRGDSRGIENGGSGGRGDDGGRAAVNVF